MITYLNAKFRFPQSDLPCWHDNNRSYLLDGIAVLFGIEQNNC